MKSPRPSTSIDLSMERSTLLSSDLSIDVASRSSVLSIVLSIVFDAVVLKSWSRTLLIRPRGARTVRISLFSRKRRMSCISKSSGS